MIRLRFAAAFVATVLLAACGGGNSLPGAPSSMPSNAPTATPSSATIAVSTTGVTQALSVSNGATAQIGVIAAAGSATSTSILVSSSTTAPSGSPTIASGKRQAMSGTRVPIAYFLFVSSATVQLGSYPSFQLTFPAAILPTGTTIHEAFLDASTQPPGYSYDIASGPNAATLTATGIGPTLVAGRPYIFAFYYETASAATPSPGPTATPTATVSSTPSPTPTPAVTPTATPTASATPAPTTTPSVAPTASPTPSASTTPVASGSATFTSASGYNGLLAQIASLATTESGNLYQGYYNATFFSIPSGQTAGLFGNGADGAHPNRNITLEVNDNVPISTTVTYGSADFTNSKILLTYAEQFGSGGYGSGRYWIANGGTITFENVANGSATYRIRGATFKPDTSFTSNQATGTFVLDAVGTANPFSQK